MGCVKWHALLNTKNDIEILVFNMIYTNTTMFVVPDMVTFNPTYGLRYELDLKGPIVAHLVNMGFDTNSICEAFRKLFDLIPREIISKKIFRHNRKWWQLYEARYKTVYEDKNLEFKLRLLNYINTGEFLKRTDIERLRHYYYGLSPEFQEIIPMHILIKKH